MLGRSETEGEGTAVNSDGVGFAVDSSVVSGSLSLSEGRTSLPDPPSSTAVDVPVSCVRESSRVMSGGGDIGLSSPLGPVSPENLRETGDVEGCELSRYDTSIPMLRTSFR